MERDNAPADFPGTFKMKPKFYFTKNGKYLSIDQLNFHIKDAIKMNDLRIINNSEIISYDEKLNGNKRLTMNRVVNRIGRKMTVEKLKGNE